MSVAFIYIYLRRELHRPAMTRGRKPSDRCDQAFDGLTFETLNCDVNDLMVMNHQNDAPGQHYLGRYKAILKSLK